MYVGLDENGGVDTRYEDTSAEMLMKSVPDVVLHKVPDELGDFGRGIYKYKMVEGAFVLKDDLSDWEEKNKRAIINSYRSHRDELLRSKVKSNTSDRITKRDVGALVAHAWPEATTNHGEQFLRHEAATEALRCESSKNATQCVLAFNEIPDVR